jgi:integrase
LKNINVEGGVWKVDASLSKSKRSRSIPLNDSALWVLEQLTSEGKSEYLFPSPVTGKPYTTITRAWYRLRSKAGVPNVRLHDLRHSFASLLVSAGRSLYEVQHILGHSDPKVTMRYAHLSGQSLQEAANAASVIVRAAPAQS